MVYACTIVKSINDVNVVSMIGLYLCQNYILLVSSSVLNVKRIIDPYIERIETLYFHIGDFSIAPRYFIDQQNGI